MRAVAVGDSITRTGGVTPSDELASLSWSQRVACRAGWDLDTFAVSGYATAQMLALVPQSGAYDVALVCAGTNDVLPAHSWNPAAFRAALGSLLERVGQVAERTVVLGLVPNVGALPAPFAYGWGRQCRVDAANGIIAEVGRHLGAQVVIPCRLSRPLEMFGDGVHPTSYGHVRLANQVLEVLGVDPVVVGVVPSDAYLRASRRRTLADSVKRPPRGLAGSLVATLRQG